jgi:hypothetical protein
MTNGSTTEDTDGTDKLNQPVPATPMLSRVMASCFLQGFVNHGLRG